MTQAAEEDHAFGAVVGWGLDERGLYAAVFEPGGTKAFKAYVSDERLAEVMRIAADRVARGVPRRLA